MSILLPPLLVHAVGCTNKSLRANGGWLSLPPLCLCRGMIRPENEQSRRRRHRHHGQNIQRHLYQTLSMKCKQPIITSAQTSSSSSSSSSTTLAKNDHFLIPGFQPRANCDNSMSLFTDAPSRGSLPILDASVILSPGRYCKISSWSASYHRHKGTNSGIDAAQRLIRARREFVHLIQSELSSGIHNAATNCERMENKSTTRKMYALTGHGVPNGLLRHFTNVARNWLLRLRNNPGGSSSGIGSDDDNRGQRSQQPTSVAETQHQKPSSPLTNIIVLTNSPNSTLLDQNQVQFIDSHGISINAPSFPLEWEYDFEVYMVVMDRMGSRLAAIAATQQPPLSTSSSSSAPSFFTSSTLLHSDNQPYHEPTSSSLHSNSNINSSSHNILTPQAILQQWNVTIMNEEALPMCLLPESLHSSSSSTHRRRCRGSTRTEEGKVEDTIASIPKLSLEWVKLHNNDCWKVILRLQDSGGGSGGGGRGDECSGKTDDDLPTSHPVSLVFEGEYYTTTPTYPL